MSQRREDGAAGDRETQRRARPGGLGSGEHATGAAGAGDLELTDGRPVGVGLTPRTPLDLPPFSAGVGPWRPCDFSHHHGPAVGGLYRVLSWRLDSPFLTASVPACSGPVSPFLFRPFIAVTSSARRGPSVHRRRTVFPSPSAGLLGTSGTSFVLRFVTLCSLSVCYVPGPRAKLST